MEFLQQANVEDIMNSCSDRQLQLIRHIPDAFQDLEWPIELWPELAPPLDVQRCDRAVDEAETNPPSSRKSSLSDSWSRKTPRISICQIPRECELFESRPGTGRPSFRRVFFTNSK
jgi:hypothetical protein